MFRRRWRGPNPTSTPADAVCWCIAASAATVAVRPMSASGACTAGPMLVRLLCCLPPGGSMFSRSTAGSLAAEPRCPALPAPPSMLPRVRLRLLLRTLLRLTLLRRSDDAVSPENGTRDVAVVPMAEDGRAAMGALDGGEPHADTGRLLPSAVGRVAACGCGGKPREVVPGLARADDPRRCPALLYAGGSEMVTIGLAGLRGGEASNPRNAMPLLYS